MTMNAPRPMHPKPSFTELSGNADTAGSAIGQIPKDDVLQYIREMCATLAYMSMTYDCDHLAQLLEAAAWEAERGIATRETG